MHEYLYGAVRIAQVDLTPDTGAPDTIEYFLTDALGSVRQLVNQPGAVTFTQAYDPYGVVTTSTGPSASGYGFTGEYQQDGLVYLRARHYAPGMGRFLTRDTWNGQANRSLSFNRWAYVEGNPVNLTDPSGMITCYDSNDPECVRRVYELRNKGLLISTTVKNGDELPVEALAKFVDYAYELFDYNTHGSVWAITNVLTGIDVNHSAAWQEMISGHDGQRFFIGFDWLPYNNNSLHDVKDYYEKDRPWIHSRRGNWHRNYWDKTANQAYHFWGFVAFSYVDGSVVAHAGNLLHDSPIWQEEIDFRDETKAPPILGYTKEDWNLSLRGIELGSILKRNSSYAFIFECEDNPSLEFASKFLIYPGNWIRANLKDPAISVEHGR